MLDYLRGLKPADAAFERFPHRSITVTTWVEVMDAAPLAVSARTRDFLRNFERLAINEAIADRALELMKQHERLNLRHAVPWATAQVNALVYVTADFPRIAIRDERVWVPYSSRSRAPR